MWVRDDYGISFARDFSRSLHSPEQLDIIWDAIREGKRFIDLREVRK